MPKKPRVAMQPSLFLGTEPKDRDLQSADEMLSDVRFAGDRWGGPTASLKFSPKYGEFTGPDVFVVDESELPGSNFEKEYFHDKGSQGRPAYLNMSREEMFIDPPDEIGNGF